MNGRGETAPGGTYRHAVSARESEHRQKEGPHVNGESECTYSVGSALMESTDKAPEEMLSSGISMVTVGVSEATTERTANVTLIDQSADWFAGRIDVCPTFEISREVSSKKTGPVEARSG